jgi:hypothetical protein
MKTAKRDFRASITLKLHQKAVDILDMIVSCDKRIGNAKDYLNRYYAAKNDSFSMLRLFNTEEDLISNVTRWEKVKERLTRYYIDVMGRINKLMIDFVESKLSDQEIDLLLQEKLS